MRVFISPDYTGTNPYQRHLTEELRNRDVEVESVDVHGPLMPAKVVRERGLPDVFHLHWLHPFFVGRNGVFTALMGAVLLAQVAILRLLGVRFVWTVHNLVTHDAPNPRLERAYKHVFVRFIDAVIVHCEDAAETVRRAYRLPQRYANRIHVVPHGHYVDSYENEVTRAEARAELGLDDEFVFLYFGRVCGYKNIPTLIEAFGGIEDPEARLLVVGNPRNERSEAEVLGAARGDERVGTTLTFVPESDVQYYMNAADVVVLPFQEILTSGSTVLAMSFGKPVVVPDEGCVSSLVPSAGGFTYRDAPGALEATMRRSMDADLETVGRANRRAALARDWANIARLTADAYRERPRRRRNAAHTAEA